MNTIQTMKNHAKKTLQIAALSAAMLFSVNGFADPIHIAVKKGDTAEVKRLIKAGADVNAQDEHGSTLLHVAAYRGKTEIALALIKAGAIKDEKYHSALAAYEAKKKQAEWDAKTPQQQESIIASTLKQARIAYTAQPNIYSDFVVTKAVFTSDWLDDPEFCETTHNNQINGLKSLFKKVSYFGNGETRRPLTSAEKKKYSGVGQFVYQDQARGYKISEQPILAINAVLTECDDVVVTAAHAFRSGRREDSEVRGKNGHGPIPIDEFRYRSSSGEYYEVDTEKVIYGTTNPAKYKYDDWVVVKLKKKISGVSPVKVDRSVPRRGGFMGPIQFVAYHGDQIDYERNRHKASIEDCDIRGLMVSSDEQLDKSVIHALHACRTENGASGGLLSSNGSAVGIHFGHHGATKHHGTDYADPDEPKYKDPKNPEKYHAGRGTLFTGQLMKAVDQLCNAK